MSAFRLAPFDAVVFDMDGTLLDTEIVFRTVAWDVAESLGFSMRDDVHGRMVGSAYDTMRGVLVEAYGVSFPFEQFDAECKRLMHSRMLDAVPVKAGVRELIAELSARNIPMAVATSSPAVHAMQHLGTAGLLEVFRTIVSRDDVLNPKPHPEPFLLAAERLVTAPGRCLAIEDSHAGVRAAAAAGMQTVMVPDLVPPTDELRALCAAVMPSLAEVRTAAFADAV